MWWLERHRRATSLHSCGHPREVCADPERDWFPQMEVCYVQMARDAAQAKWTRLHADADAPWHDGTHTRWAKEASASHPYHRDHGVTIWVSGEDLGLGGDFLGATKKARGDDAEAEDAERGGHHEEGGTGGLVGEQE